MKDQVETTVARLVAIKRQELDRYRQDLGRLQQIADQHGMQFDAAQKCETEFLEETRQSERLKKILNAAEMIERRRYLVHLQEQKEEQRTAYDRAIEQRDQAHRCLKEAFQEIRTLERLAERRRTRAYMEQQRAECLRADDQEITRSTHRGEAHVHY